MRLYFQQGLSQNSAVCSKNEHRKRAVLGYGERQSLFFVRGRLSLPAVLKSYDFGAQDFRAKCAVLRESFQQQVWWRIGIIYLAIALAVGGLAYRNTHAPTNQSNQSNQKVALKHVIEEGDATNTQVLSGLPSRIVVPTVGIDLKVVNGYYNASKQTWSVSNDSANYAANTHPSNNQKGTTLIYGHDKSGIFHNLHNLQAGDEVAVHTDNGHVFVYSYIASETEVISPNNTTLFAMPATKPRLLLMTCDGIWSQNRIVMSFELKGAE